MCVLRLSIAAGASLVWPNTFLVFNNLKILLANEATKILHGEAAAKKAEKTAKETFSGSGIGKDLPEIKVKLREINKGINLLDLISENKIMSSKGEVRRAIANKGLKLNNVLVIDDKKVIKNSDFEKDILKISFGKKKHYLVKVI